MGNTGAAAEAYCAGYLERRGWQVLARNFRVRGGEIDLVALHEDVLVFVEVKARTGEHAVVAEETVDARKLRRIMLAADAFLQQHGEYADLLWRIDMLAITLDGRGIVRRMSHFDNLTLDE
jgi:putative endonuclease